MSAPLPAGRLPEWLSRSILANQTVLVSDLLNDVISRRNNRYGWDLVENLYDDSVEAVEAFLTEASGLDADALDAVWETPFDEREALAREIGWQPEPRDVFEWWLVTRELAEDLYQRGEPMLAHGGNWWWGRCITGQALALDEVLQAVARDRSVCD